MSSATAGLFPDGEGGVSKVDRSVIATQRSPDRYGKRITSGTQPSDLGSSFLASLSFGHQPNPVFAVRSHKHHEVIGAVQPFHDVISHGGPP
jgi:hypothetical protein